MKTRIAMFVGLFGLLAAAAFFAPAKDQRIGGTWLIWCHMNDSVPNLDTPERKHQIASINEEASKAMSGLMGKELITTP